RKTSAVAATSVTHRILLKPAVSLSKSPGPLILPTLRNGRLPANSSFIKPRSARPPNNESCCRWFRDSSNRSEAGSRSLSADGVSAKTLSPDSVQAVLALMKSLESAAKRLSVPTIRAWAAHSRQKEEKGPRGRSDGHRGSRAGDFGFRRDAEMRPVLRPIPILWAEDYLECAAA